MDKQELITRVWLALIASGNIRPDMPGEAVAAIISQHMNQHAVLMQAPLPGM
mgnify:FL=1